MFSIVIPLYNKESFIVRALDSILNQTFKDYETIIIDDGSTDNSRSISSNWIKKLEEKDKVKFRIISIANNGVSNARNIGALEAKNEYIVFLDADDYWENNHLDNIRNLIKDYSSSVDIFSCAIKQIQGKKIVHPRLGKFENFTGIIDFFEASLISSGFIHSSSVCIKKEVIINNPFPTNMKNHEDIVTWARISNKKGIAFSSKKSSIQSLNSIEASLSIDFRNYVRFKELILKIDYSKIKLFIFVHRYILLSLLFVRLELPTHVFLNEFKSIFGKDLILNILLIAALLTPKKLISCARNIRKQYV